MDELDKLIEPKGTSNPEDVYSYLMYLAHAVLNENYKDEELEDQLEIYFDILLKLGNKKEFNWQYGPRSAYKAAIRSKERHFLLLNKEKTTYDFLVSEYNALKGAFGKEGMCLCVLGKKYTSTGNFIDNAVFLPLHFLDAEEENKLRNVILSKINFLLKLGLKEKDIDKRIFNLTSKKISEEVKIDSHLRIFSTHNAIKLFKYLHEQPDDKVYTKYNLIYCAMKYDGLINEWVKPDEFILWLSSEYNIEIDQTFKPFKRYEKSKRYADYKLAKLTLKVY